MQEIDHHLLADAGQELEPPPLAGPRLGRPQPARAVLVRLAQPVPDELHLHPAVLVGVDLLPARADHYGGLRAGGPRHRGQPLRPHRHGGRAAGERVGVARPAVAQPGHPRVAGRVVHRHEDVLGVGGVGRVAGQGEGGPGAERRAPAGAGGQVVPGFLRLQPGLHQRAAAVRLQVGAGEVEPLERLGLADRHHGVGGGQQARRRAGEVVVGAGRLAGGEGAGLLPGEDGLDVARLRPVLDLGVRGAGGVRRRRVGQHQGVLVGGEGVGVEDALGLEQPGDEGQGRLPVLDAVLAGRVGGGQAELVVAEPVAVEHRLDDVRHRLVLEDAAVDGLGQEPEPGHHLGPVLPPPAADDRAGGEPADQPVERPWGVVRRGDRPADRLAE